MLMQQNEKSRQCEQKHGWMLGGMMGRRISVCVWGGNYESAMGGLKHRRESTL